MLIRLWKYLRGYVIIEVYGFSVERFMNLATNKGIYLWDIYRDGNKLVISVSVKGFKMLKSCTKKTRCRIKVRQKIGLPFIIYKYRNRKIFLLGFLITCIIVLMLSSVLWTIEIEGNENFSDNQILEILESQGCRVGAVKFNINCDKIENEILTTYPEISWISMEIRGSGLFVNIVEAVKTPEIKPDNLPPTNIVANKECLIEYIVTRSGKPLVKKGDVVKKGEVLVTGELEIIKDDQSIEYAYVNADAEIIGKVYYSIKDEISLNYTQKNFTDKRKYEVYLTFLESKLRIIRPFSYFSTFDKSYEDKEFKIWGYKMPIGLSIVTHYEYIPQNMTYSEDEAKNILLKKIDKVIEKNFNEKSEIIDKTIVYTNNDDKLLCDVKIIALENIGEEQLIKERLEEWTQEDQ